MKDSLREKCELLADNYTVIEKNFKWEFNMMYLVAAINYTSMGMKADTEKMKECREILKKKHGVFSELRSTVELAVISKMALEQNPAAYLDELTGVFEKYIVLAKDISSLGVSDDDVFNTCILKHGCTDLTGKCPFILDVEVFCTYVYVAALNCCNHRYNVDSGHAVYYVHCIVLYKILKLITELNCLTGSHVHLPVAGYDSSSCHF